MDERDEKAEKVRELLLVDRAAALSLAVLFLTGATLDGCVKSPFSSSKNETVIQRAVQAERGIYDPYISDGKHGYYQYTGGALQPHVAKPGQTGAPAARTGYRSSYPYHHHHYGAGGLLFGRTFQSGSGFHFGSGSHSGSGFSFGRSGGFSG
ncbi:MAG: hypothetical protein AB9903_17120 [Vulcanimicrobiota bacterium]